MQSDADISIDEETGTLQIQNLTITDQTVTEFFSEVPPEEREETIALTFKVGASTLRLSETSKDVEFVKQEFTKLQAKFEDELNLVESELDDKFGEEGHVEQLLESHFGDGGSMERHIKRAFGEDGHFSRRLDEELGEDGERFQAALDPGREGTPTHRLKQNLLEEIREIRDAIIGEEAREEERQYSPKKGYDFEDTLYDLLSQQVHGSQDTFEFTGESYGEMSESKVGDFVITLGETSQRMVVEAKSGGNYNQPAILSEMEEAIENRDADYGLFVTESETDVPDKVGYFQEWDNQILSVALSGGKDDSLEPGFLNIAYSWARMRCLQAHFDTGTEVDTEEIQGCVEQVRDTIDRFRNVRRQCTNIEQNVGDIRGLLEDIESDVMSELDRINSELSKQAAQTS